MLHLYSIHDIKSRVWSAPQTHESEESLFQFLTLLVNTHGAGDYHVYPEDFVVYKIAEFHPEHGQLVFLEEKLAVGTLSSLKKHCKYCEQQALDDEVQFQKYKETEDYKHKQQSLEDNKNE